jgi:hypothetical protein
MRAGVFDYLSHVVYTQCTECSGDHRAKYGEYCNCAEGDNEHRDQNKWDQRVPDIFEEVRLVKTVTMLEQDHG